MRPSKLLLIALMILLLSASVPLAGICLPVTPAQAAGPKCPDLVQQAINAAKQCRSIGRNKTCYGNILINAQPQPGITSFKFNTVGDSVNVDTVKSLRLSSFDEALKRWGIALLRVQASLPGAASGQNIKILLFGNVDITDASQKVSPPVRNMQAFYFQDTLNTSVCYGVPSSGVVLQTPKGSRKVQVVANGVKLSIGSTVALQAQAGKQLIIRVLEGKVEVTSAGVKQEVLSGTMSRVPMDQNLEASGPPSAPESYEMESLPLVLTEALLDPISVSSPVRPECLDNDAKLAANE